MKIILSILTAILLTISSTTSQTEVWRLSGVHRFIVPGDNGNIYLVRLGSWDFYNSIPDTLMKVSPDGSILWQRIMDGIHDGIHDRIKDVLYNGNGLFLLFEDQDSVAYVNNAGIYSKFHIPESQRVYEKAVIDQTGHLLLLIDNNLSASLIKIDTTGNKKYNINISLPPTIQGSIEDGPFYHGPIIDNKGKVWILIQFVTHREIEKNRTYFCMDSLQTFAYQLNASTGSFIFQKHVLRELASYVKESPKSHLGVYLEDIPYFQHFCNSDGNIIAAGKYRTQKIKYSGTSESEENIGEWRILIIDQNGKSKLIKYKGKGLNIQRWKGGSSKTDDEYNHIFDITADDGSNVYISGGIASGKMVNWQGDFYCTNVLAKLNTMKKKFTWIKKNSGGGYLSVTKSQQIMNFSDYHYYFLSVYDSNGQKSTTNYYFPYQQLYWPFPKKLNNEDNAVFLNIYRNENFIHQVYFAKFSIIPPNFVQHQLSSVVEDDNIFEVFGNYPNPFNSTTTISYYIPNQSMVWLKVFNILGQEVARLVDGELLDSGVQEVIFDSGHLSSGVYFYHITVHPEENEDGLNPAFNSTMKMVIMK